MFEMRTPQDPAPLDQYEETTAAARVGHRIRKIRLARGMTQAALGTAIGLDANRIQKYENGYRKPKAALLKKIARTLNVSPLALSDPDTTCLTGAMFAFFELEELFNMEIVEGPDDMAPMICLSVGPKNALYPYLREWLDLHKQVASRLESASSDKDREWIMKAYQNWKWSYPGSVLDLDDIARKKEDLLKKIRALQEEYDRLS
jgi:transcriptional regulator with XRE-family HTH domain